MTGPKYFVSEQDIYYTYVCAVSPCTSQNVEYATIAEENDGDDTATDLVQVEKSKAEHKIDLQQNSEEIPNTSRSSNVQPASVKLEKNAPLLESPKLLKLTRLKWLSDTKEENYELSTNCSSPHTISPVSSTGSFFSAEANSDAFNSERHMSTILQIDKEHNLFGFSNIAMNKPQVVTSQASKKRKYSKAAFHQTTIVNHSCCRTKSRSDFPNSLKCGGSCCSSRCSTSRCSTRCSASLCAPCPRDCRVVCRKTSSKSVRPRKKRACFSCGRCCRGGPVPRSSLAAKCFGMTITVKKPPKFEPYPVELTPRSSCIMGLPLMARECTHCPPCILPGPGCQYLMPCYWPSRPSAPCTDPLRCFHNPPCRPPRAKLLMDHPLISCPKKGIPCTQDKRCVGCGVCPHRNDSKSTCKNILCPGKLKEMNSAIANYKSLSAQKKEPSKSSVSSKKKESSKSSVGKK